MFTKAPRTLTQTSPAGRQVTTTLDDAGRVAQIAMLGVLPVQLAYDAHGRLETVTQGARTLTRVHGADGFLASIVDPLGQARVFDVDAVGRVLAETRADGEDVLFGYDAASNRLSVTPPGQPSHGFGFTPVDLTASYDPPALPGGPTPATWSYDLDRKPALVTKPGGVQVSYVYDAAGRPASITFPGGSITRSYHATTGKLTAIAGPAGVSVGFAYDGHLVTDVTWSGLVSGTLHRTFDNDLRVVSESVNGGAAVSFGYDDDGLLASAGALAVTRDAQNGRVTGSTAGIVADVVGYDAFGAVAHRTFTANGAALFSVTYVRDALDRIVERTETLEGETHTYAYTYDAAGRLMDVTKDGAPAAQYTYDENGNRLGRTTPAGTDTGSYDDIRIVGCRPIRDRPAVLAREYGVLPTTWVPFLHDYRPDMIVDGHFERCAVTFSKAHVTNMYLIVTYGPDGLRTRFFVTGPYLPSSMAFDVAAEPPGDIPSYDLPVPCFFCKQRRSRVAGMGVSRRTGAAICYECLLLGHDAFREDGATLRRRERPASRSPVQWLPPEQFRRRNADSPDLVRLALVAPPPRVASARSK